MGKGWDADDKTVMILLTESRRVMTETLPNLPGIDPGNGKGVNGR